RYAQVCVEPRRGVLPYGILRLLRELDEELRDELLVLERSLVPAELVERPVARVEARQHHLRRDVHRIRERLRSRVAGRLRIVAERDDCLELRVEHDLAVEAVEPDPRTCRAP